MGRVRRFMVLAVVVALVTAPAAAPADDHQPPEAFLKVAGKSQRGWMTSFSWAGGGTNFCWQVTGATIFGAPSPEPVPIPVLTEEAAIVFHKHQRPRQVQIEAWPLEVDGEPFPQRMAVDFRLEKRSKGTRWAAVFEPYPVGTMFLEVEAIWNDVDNCGFQHVSWRFAMSATEVPG